MALYNCHHTEDNGHYRPVYPRMDHTTAWGVADTAGESAT